MHLLITNAKVRKVQKKEYHTNQIFNSHFTRAGFIEITDWVHEDWRSDSINQEKFRSQLDLKGQRHHFSKFPVNLGRQLELLSDTATVKKIEKEKEGFISLNRALVAINCALCPEVDVKHSLNFSCKEDLTLHKFVYDPFRDKICVFKLCDRIFDMLIYYRKKKE